MFQLWRHGWKKKLKIMQTKSPETITGRAFCRILVVTKQTNNMANLQLPAQAANTPLGETDIWKDIPEFEGFYQASILGNIRSVDRIIVTSRGASMKLLGVNLKAALSQYYYTVVLSKNGKPAGYLVHRLVALTFLKPPSPERIYVNHKNRNRLDNRPNNLEWCTQKENVQHSLSLIDHGFRYGPHIKKPSPPVEMQDTQTGEILFFKTREECAEYFKINLSAIFQAGTCNYLLLKRYKITSMPKRKKKKNHT